MRRSKVYGSGFGGSSGRSGRGRFLLLLAISLSIGSAACRTIPTPPEDIYCPMPTTAEIDDYAAIVEADPDRHAVRWIARIIAYCFPDPIR